MRIFKIFVAGFLALGLHSVKVQASTPHELDDIGFAIDLPTGWEFKSFPGQKFKIAFGPKTDGTPSIIPQWGPSTMSVQEWGSSLMEKIQTGAMGYSGKVLDSSFFETNDKRTGMKVSHSMIRPDGRTAYQYTYIFEYKSGNPKASSYSDQPHLIFFTCTSVDDPNYTPTFDTIIQSLHEKSVVVGMIKGAIKGAILGGLHIKD
jgi:hypothetical protein